MAELSEHQLDAIATDTGVRAARLTSWVIGATWSAAGMLGAPTIGVWITANPGASQDTTAVISAVVSLGVLAVGLGLGLTHFVAAWGLIDGKRWAYLLSLGLGAMAALGCVPVGAVLLVALLNPTTRRHFLD
ncbi:MAG: hypothetical protein KTR31_35855 [Myxococcales bacterium]|nr:hypothetical protein [Myxococcales bacterium]